MLRVLALALTTLLVLGADKVSMTERVELKPDVCFFFSFFVWRARALRGVQLGAVMRRGPPPFLLRPSTPACPLPPPVAPSQATSAASGSAEAGVVVAAAAGADAASGAAAIGSAVAAAAAAAEAEAEAKCHPKCRWQCTHPTCDQICAYCLRSLVCVCERARECADLVPPPPPPSSRRPRLRKAALQARVRNARAAGVQARVQPAAMRDPLPRAPVPDGQVSRVPRALPRALLPLRVPARAPADVPLHLREAELRLEVPQALQLPSPAVQDGLRQGAQLRHAR